MVLPDGDEMNTYFSDPLKIDSDDDGFTDKEEITAGTGQKTLMTSHLFRRMV